MMKSVRIKTTHSLAADILINYTFSSIILPLSARGPRAKHHDGHVRVPPHFRTTAT